MWVQELVLDGFLAFMSVRHCHVTQLLQPATSEIY